MQHDSEGGAEDVTHAFWKWMGNGRRGALDVIGMGKTRDG